MPQITVEIDDRALVAHFDRILPGVEAALETALKPVASAMAASARAAAAAHIRYLGKKPGLYLASIYGGTFRRPGMVGGFVRSASPLAHLLEEGFDYPAQEISAAAGSVLAFSFGSVDTMFARHVRREAMRVGAYPALGPAFDGLRGDVEAALRSAADGVE